MRAGAAGSHASRSMCRPNDEDDASQEDGRRYFLSYRFKVLETPPGEGFNEELATRVLLSAAHSMFEKCRTIVVFDQSPGHYGSARQLLRDNIWAQFEFQEGAVPAPDGIPLCDLCGTACSVHDNISAQFRPPKDERERRERQRVTKLSVAGLRKECESRKLESYGTERELTTRIIDDIAVSAPPSSVALYTHRSRSPPLTTAHPPQETPTCPGRFNGAWEIEFSSMTLEQLFLFVMGMIMFLYSKEDRHQQEKSKIKREASGQAEDERRKYLQKTLAIKREQLEADKEKRREVEEMHYPCPEQRANAEEAYKLEAELNVQAAEAMLEERGGIFELFPATAELFRGEYGVTNSIRHEIDEYLDAKNVIYGLFLARGKRLASGFCETIKLVHDSMHAQTRTDIRAALLELERVCTLMCHARECPPCEAIAVVCDTFPRLFKHVSKPSWQALLHCLSTGRDWHQLSSTLASVTEESIA